MSWVWIQSVAEIGRAERQRIQSITEITIPFHSRWKILACQTSNQRTEQRPKVAWAYRKYLDYYHY